MMDDTELRNIANTGVTAIFGAYSVGNFTAAMAAFEQMLTDIQALCTSTHEEPEE